MSKSQQQYILGIDLGTTKCMACVQKPGADTPTIIRPHPVPHTHDYLDYLTSAFCWTKDGAVLGEPANELLRDVRFSKDVVRFVKRSMDIPDKVLESGGKVFDPVSISGMFIAHLKRCAEQQLNTSITDVVITVPAYFGNVERAATREAARKVAGFDADKVHLLDEPIAAAYGLKLHLDRRERLVMVADLGGGTFDATLLSVGPRLESGGFHELGRDGDSHLGGLNWDKEIAYIAARILLPRQPSAEFYKKTNVGLYKECEKAKIAMCENEDLPGQVDFVLDDVLYPAPVRPDVFRRRTAHLAQRCALICKRLLDSVPKDELRKLRKRTRPLTSRLFPSSSVRKLTWQDVDEILLVGGGSRIRAVREELMRVSGKDSQDVRLADRPQHQVAYGAALVGAALNENRDLFSHMHVRCPHSIGYWYYPPGTPKRPPVFSPIIERNTKVPHTAHKKIPVGGGESGELKLEIVEERKHLQPHTNKSADQCRLIKPWYLRGLPPRSGRGQEHLMITLEYYSDRDIKFLAQFRGLQGDIEVNV